MEKVTVINSRNKYIKKGIYIFVYCFLTFVFFFIEIYSPTRQCGDTAIFQQVVESIRANGMGNSHIFASTQDVIDRSILSQDVEQRISDKDEWFENKGNHERNMMNFHSYLILYLLAPFTLIFKSYHIITFSQAASYSLIVVLSYMFLEKKKIPFVYRLLIVLLLIFHPGFSFSVIDGMFYPDRLFMGFGFLLLYLISVEEKRKAMISLVALLCALCGERAALYTGAFLIAYTVLFWYKVDKKTRIFFGSLGAIEIIYYFVLSKFVINNVYYSQLSISAFISNLQMDYVRKNLVLFLLINIATYGIIMIFDWRAAIIGFCALIPNIVTNIGGAEKLGWYAHYHTYYYTILIWAVCMGAIGLYQRTNKKRCLSYILVGLSILACILIDPFDTSINISPQNIKNNIFPRIGNSLESYEFKKKSYNDFSDFIRGNIESDAKVSSIEKGMTFLVDNGINDIHYFPMNTKEADYCLVVFVDGKFGGADSFGGVEKTEKLQEFVFHDLLVEEGYDMDKIITSNNGLYPYAIIKKK